MLLFRPKASPFFERKRCDCAGQINVEDCAMCMHFVHANPFFLVGDATIRLSGSALGNALDASRSHRGGVMPAIVTDRHRRS
jgi:hypothetical protein